MNGFGISIDAMKIFNTIIEKHNSIKKIILFGSRAKGNYDKRSDVDLAICESNVSRKELGEIISEINDSDFPYLVDLKIYEEITNRDLVTHIDRVGKLFYESK